jgi:hypothetical protein
LVHEDRSLDAGQQRVGATLGRRAERLGVEERVELLEAFVARSATGSTPEPRAMPSSTSARSDA